MRPVDNSELARWRELNAVTVLLALSEHAKQDPSFKPLKDPSTTRWHASVSGREFELLLTGPKFWDTRSNKGGGGAIDMAMWVLDLSFKQAAQLLTARGL
jgi:hypothetical protein